MKKKLFGAMLAAAMTFSLLGGAACIYAESADVATEDLDNKEDELVIGSTRDIAPADLCGQ